MLIYINIFWFNLLLWCLIPILSLLLKASSNQLPFKYSILLSKNNNIAKEINNDDDDDDDDRGEKEEVCNSFIFMTLI